MEVEDHHVVQHGLLSKPLCPGPGVNGGRPGHLRVGVFGQNLHLVVSRRQLVGVEERLYRCAPFGTLAMLVLEQGPGQPDPWVVRDVLQETFEYLSKLVVQQRVEDVGDVGAYGVAQRWLVSHDEL